MAVDVFAQIRRSVAAAPLDAYAAGRARQPELRPFAEPLAALAEIAARHEAEAERGVLVAALLAEHRRRTDALWPSMLILAFEASLRATFREVRAGGDEDISQAVLCRFLEVIDSPQIAGSGACAPPRVRVELGRIAQRVRRACRRDRGMVALAHDGEAPESTEAQRAADDAPCAFSREELVAAVHACTPDPVLRDAVFATCAGDVTLQDFVDARYPELDGKRRKCAYERLRVSIRGVLASLRQALGPDVGRLR